MTKDETTSEVMKLRELNGDDLGKQVTLNDPRLHVKITGQLTGIRHYAAEVVHNAATKRLAIITRVDVSIAGLELDELDGDTHIEIEG
jgi:hypothetical protein